MATESQNDWLATLGSQLSDSLESSVALRAVTDLLEEIADAEAADAPWRWPPLCAGRGPRARWDIEPSKDAA